MLPTVAPLAGYTVGVTAQRRAAELGAALERQGARVRYGAAIHLVPLADDGELRAATQRCLDLAPDYVVATTGVGVQGWLTAAEQWGVGDALHRTLQAATLLARGPKVQGALRGRGLREAWSPASESSDELLEHLLAGPPLAGRRIAIQLHGDPLTHVVAALRAAGAEVIEVPVYRWLPPVDPQPLATLIAATAAAELDCVTFTSAPAATSVLHTADRLGHGAGLRAALAGPVLAAAVGAVTAAPLRAAGLPVLVPERHRLGALVREVVRRLPEREPVEAGRREARHGAETRTQPPGAG